LTAPDVQGPKRRKGEASEDVKHVPSSLLAGNRADIPWFGTIVGASEIGVTDIDVALRPSYGIRQEAVHVGGKRDTANLIGAEAKEEPLSGQVNGQCRDDPVRSVISLEMFLEKYDTVRLLPGACGTFTPQQVILYRVHQDKVPLFPGPGQSLEGKESEPANTYDPDLFHDMP
jgi:hypothetical protein